MLSLRALPIMIAAAAMAPLLAAAQPSPDGYYAGRLTCAAVPAKSFGPLNIAFNMTLSHGNVTYRRGIYTPDGKTHVTDETGEGKVSADGTIALSGRAEFVDWHFTATYNGKMAGNTAELGGSQHWEYTDGTIFDRACKATVTHS